MHTYNLKAKPIKNTEWFKIELAELNPNLIIRSRYISGSKIIRVECKTEGYMWETTPNDLLKTNGKCPECEKRKLQSIKNNYIRQLAEKSPNIELVGEFICASNRTKFRCNLHDYEWDTIPSYILKTGKCPKCSGSYKKTTEEFKEELRTINPDIKILEEYTGSKSLMLVRCLKCGNEWDGVPEFLLKGRGCKNCNKSGKPKRKEVEI